MLAEVLLAQLRALNASPMSLNPTLCPAGSPENPASQKSWRRQRRHVFILSNAGKPIWALHGSEDALAGFMAVIQAMLAFVQGREDRMHSMR